ncbi:alkaline phosphatase family protein [Elusimicrobiota bacterium]
MNSNKSNLNKKVIILGFDGLSPVIVDSMMAEGLLPNFTNLKNRGDYKELSTTNPPQSPVAWASFATGQNPGKHGLFDFIIRDPATYNLDLSISSIQNGKAQRVIKTKSFWHYTSEKKIPTTIITCPVTFPPDKIHGRMLSGMGVPDILGTEGTFTFYTTEKKPENSVQDTGGRVFHIDKSEHLTLNLIGPRTAGPGGSRENLKNPFTLTIKKDSVLIKLAKKQITLYPGQWSDWNKTTFKLGPFKRMKGIFKFYLVSTDPELRLYISPINFDPASPYFPLSYPDDYCSDLEKLIGPYYTQGMPMDTWAVNEKRLTEEPFIDQATEVLKEKTQMLNIELDSINEGVLFCYFESSDIIQHMFWRYIDTQHPLYEQDAPLPYRQLIRTWYMKLDNILGTVLQRLSEDDIIIVLSDHGFDTFRRAVHVNSWLKENGYLRLKQTHGKPPRELLLDIDWPNTKAFSIGFGAIYINQKGRERDGIVSPGRETEVLKKEIAGKLRQWRDDKYNKNVISEIYEKEEIFWGPHEDKCPDLFIGFNTGYRSSWQTAIGAIGEELIEDNIKKWSGSHLFDPKLIPGILFTNFKITKTDPSIYDIAPSILKITGYNEEELKELDMDGSPLF